MTTPVITPPSNAATGLSTRPATAPPATPATGKDTNPTVPVAECASSAGGTAAADPPAHHEDGDLMAQSPRRQAPSCYILRVDGHLDAHWSAWFGDLTLTHESDGTTSLTGPVSDQAELHGLLTKVRDLGVTLISVAAIDPTDTVDP
jgi:hypothetical protein